MTENVTILMRLQGAAATIAELYRTEAAMRGLTAATKEAAVAQTGLQRRSFLMNQALFTMRRYLYQATLAATALGIGAVYVGIQFDAMVQRTTIALKYLSRGQFDANEEMRTFLQIARDTAFLPQQVIAAGQQLIAFGFNAQTTNRILRDTGDAIAALNLPQSTVDRIVLALGQIQVKGKVMGEELRQLANANIPAYRYLADAFGANVVQIGKIADAGIPAAAGIEAILKGLEKQYGGASKAIRETTSGQFEILKGDLQVIFGAIVSGAFTKLAGAMKSITDVTGQLFNAIINDHAGFMDLVDIVDEATGGTYHLRDAFTVAGDAMSALWQSTQIFFDALKPTVNLVLLATYAVVKATTAVSDLFNWTNKLSFGGISPLTTVLQALIFIMAINAGITALASIWTHRLFLQTVLLRTWERYLKVELILTTIAMTAYRAATMAAAIASTYLLLATAGLSLVVVAIIVAIAAVVIGLVILEVKFHAVSRAAVWFWNKLKDIWNWLKGHNLRGALLALVPGLGLVGGAVGIGADILGAFQTGGTAGAAGRYMVGEHGPEIVNLPAGARVSPLGVNPMNWSAAGAGGVNVTITPAPVIIDGRRIAEVVFKHRADRIARR